ncbi:MAG: hypothetical protein J0L84_20305, partial [Verrucomicrobia bacterium]|nr:hypothetical protein [Verrucomicrobiota bacterium]
PPSRLLWEIGQDAPPGTSNGTLYAELGQSNGRNDPAPGAVTRVPGDPQFSSLSNPAPDDDYYFAGTYPVGFNGLTSALTVPQDEPWTAWERSHTLGDRTNRIHFHLSAVQAASSAPLPLWLEFGGSGWSVNGVVQSGFAQHDMVVCFRSGSGVVTPLYSGRLSGPAVLNLSLIPAAAQATAGPNTLEIVRTGPAATQSGQATWIQYDYVKIQAPVPSTPPVAPLIPAQRAREQTPWSLNLGGPKTDLPGSRALFLGDGAAAGLLASPPETASWPALLSSERGWIPLNLAFQSATVPDLNWQLMPGFVRTNPAFHGGLAVTSPAVITPQHLALLLTGYEEGRDGLAGTNPPAFQQFYRASLRHAAAFLAIPTTAKTYAQAAASVTGSWTPFPGFGGAMGLSSSAAGSTLTFSNLVGRSVYIGYLATASNTLGAFQVTVDGAPAGVVDCTGAFGNRAARLGSAGTGIPANVGTQGDGSLWESPLLLRIGNLADGPHTITLQPTAGPHPVTILWASASATARQGLTPLEGPSAWIGSALRGTGHGNLLGDDAATARLTQWQREVCAELAGDGLQVRLVPTGDGYEPITGLGPDGIHPGTAGHTQIAAAFREAMITPGWDAETPPAQLTYTLLEGPAGMSLSAGGLLSWNPSEGQGGATSTVRIQIADAGFPILRATNEFTVAVTEVNSPPSSSPAADWIADAEVPLMVQWPHGDPDLPPNVLTYQLIQGPPGLQVSPTGGLTWTPTPADAPGTNLVLVLVTDNGAPPLQATQQARILVRAATDRSEWIVGTDAPPGTSTSLTYAEFAAPNARNDAPPGAVTRLPGDPQHNPTNNPTQDDDFYFGGLYPPGFNALTAPLSVPSDEPVTAYERSLASNDRTNRVHLVLSPAQVAADRRLRISFEFTGGGISSNGVTLTGFGQHEVQVPTFS